MRRVLTLVLAAMVVYFATGVDGANAAKYDEKTTERFRDASFFHGEQIDSETFLYVDLQVWHYDITRVVKIDNSKYPSYVNEVQFCYSIYVIESGSYYPIENFCGYAPVSAISLFDETGVSFLSSGLELACARDSGPYKDASKRKASEPKGLDRRLTSSTTLWYNLNNCTFAAFGQFYSGTGDQVGGVYKAHIKDPTY